MTALDDEGTTVRWRNRLAVTVGLLAGGIILALVLVLGQATRQRDRALEWQEHSYEAMILARTVDATMGQSEAMLGRFVISGEGKKDFGRLYWQLWRQAASQMDALDTLVSDPATQRLIDELRRVYALRGQELADVALRTNYGQNLQALSKFYDAGRSPNVRRMSQLLDHIMERERAMLQRRTLAAEATVTRSNAIGVVLSIFGVILVIGGGVMIWGLLQSFAARRDEEQRNLELEQAVATRTLQLQDSNARLRDEMNDREAAEARLRQAQKLEAIGQLTGGIAHDFNNMLAVVVGGLELARRRLPAGALDVRANLDRALEGAERAAALTKRLLSFARSEPLVPEATDAGALIADMSELLDRVIGDTIAVRIEAAPELWPVLVDRHQLENALLNLAVNARDAMPDGGTLTIATSNARCVEGELLDAPAGDYVRIAVSDTGVGMTPQVLERIFEPFFTTKAANQGTGLGLSQIFGFVRQSGGTVAARSSPGSGTEIAVLLPRAVATAVPIARRPQVEPVQLAPSAALTILVIEDDARVMTATTEALEELGHVAIACPTATDAPALVQQRHDIDLIISDVMMPGLTGPELIALIRAEHPDLPVLFVTGYADIGENAVFAGHRVLRKPFTIAGLEAMVEEVGRPPQAQAA